MKCKECGNDFTFTGRAHPQLLYCSKECRKKATYRQQKIQSWKQQGITCDLELYESIKKAQDNRCKICLNPLQDGVLVALDHNHKNGQIRGILCHLCNKLVGCIENIPNANVPLLLEKVRDYICVSQ